MKRLLYTLGGYINLAPAGVVVEHITTPVGGVVGLQYMLARLKQPENALPPHDSDVNTQKVEARSLSEPPLFVLPTPAATLWVTGL